MMMRRKRFMSDSRSQQQGFSLVEVSIVTALMIILAIVGVPALQSYVIENKVPKVAGDLQRFVSRMKVAGLGGGSVPYQTIDQRVLINGMRSASVISVVGDGAGAEVAHGLGGLGRAGNGIIQVAPEALPGLAQGSAFSLTLKNINHAACPSLVTTMQRMASVIKVTGSAGTVEVKNILVEPPREYQAILADAQCERGDRNTFMFIF
jgi:type II secretory pathway pseudopilin PulG